MKSSEQVLTQRQRRSIPGGDLSSGLKDRALILAVTCICLIAVPAFAGNGQQAGAQTTPRPIVIPNRSLDTHELNALAEKNAKKRNFDAANAERKRVMDDDISKLVILARDLKTKTDNMGNAPLTPVMVREAEVIEFLANDVKEKMKLTVTFD
ncbi:hypothetical protein P8935_19645 [Telmatobacter sp. DSM 110680]|uniref:Uncharacterized protein n=1 Tax=Telmatobacter sp. DSM 110680 TaxID=3036704 RepID=A0AAU7DHH8_9BACT